MVNVVNNQEQDENKMVGHEAGRLFRKYIYECNFDPKTDEDLNNLLQLSMMWFYAFNAGYEFRKNSNILNKESLN